MIIRPTSGADQSVAYASGAFRDADGAYVIEQSSGACPFGGILAAIGTDYLVEIDPDDSGGSRLAGLDITRPNSQSKAWYIRDRENGGVWSVFASPTGAKPDSTSMRLLPGEATVSSIRNKIETELTIAAVPSRACEIWRVKMTNRSARERSLTFTTFIEPAIGTPLETKYIERQRALVARKSLEAVGGERTPFRDTVLFHASTIAPARYQNDKHEFLGDGGSMSSPRHLEDGSPSSSECLARNPVLSLTVEIDLPIEGEAEFAFCFGATDSAERAVDVIDSMSTIDSVDRLLELLRSSWSEATSTVTIQSPDPALNALINRWLPYEAYARWRADRDASAWLDPWRAADGLRVMYPFSAGAPDLCRENLISFAEGLAASGTYSADGESLVMVPPRELLWLATCTARYVAETLDVEVLNHPIPLGGGPSLSLRKHCERAIRMCLCAEGEERDEADDSLLLDTALTWSLTVGEADEFAPYIEELSARRKRESRELPEERTLPRRLRYLQSCAPVLRDPAIAQAVVEALGPARAGQCGHAVDFAVHNAVVEKVLGIVATSEGLCIRPALPESWDECRIIRRFRADTYHIRVRRATAPAKQAVCIVVDGEPVLGEMLPSFDDGREHRVDVTVSALG